MQQQFKNWIQEIKEIKAIFPIPNTFCRTVTQIPLFECQALIDFYNNTNGKDWPKILLNKWGVTNRPCQWEGVKCRAGHVIALRLTEKKITGTIPESIGDLSYLTSLNIYKNNLTGTLPKSLSNLTQLTFLSLRSNQLNGPLPESIGKLSQLEILALGNNQFSGSIPNSIGNLIQLEVMYLDNNQLSGVLPKSISQLTQLENIRLNNNKLNGSLPKSIGNLLQLEELNLSSNNFNGTIPISIGKLSQAKIDLSNNQQLSGFICSAVTEIPPIECEALFDIYQLNIDKLRKNDWNETNIPCGWDDVACKNGHISKLDLSNKQLTGSIPESIGNLIYLEELSLSKNQFSGSIPEFIGQLKHLKTLRLNNNQLSGPIPEIRGNLNLLKILDLSKNQLSGSIPESIGNLKQLEGLHLHENALCGNIPLSLMNLKPYRVSLKNNHLTASNQDIINWLNRHLNHEWETSQTVCPQKIWLMILAILLLAIGIVIATIKTPMVWKKRFITLLQKTFRNENSIKPEIKPVRFDSKVSEVIKSSFLSILGVYVWKLFGILWKLFGIFMILLGILIILGLLKTAGIVGLFFIFLFFIVDLLIKYGYKILLQKTFGILGVYVWKLFGIFMILLGILIIFVILYVGIGFVYIFLFFIGYLLIKYGYKIGNYSVRRLD